MKLHKICVENKQQHEKSLDCKFLFFEWIFCQILRIFQHEEEKSIFIFDHLQLCEAQNQWA